MFTVKLLKFHYEPDSEDSADLAEESHVSISCSIYQVHKRRNGDVTITIYKNDKIWEGGTEYHLSHKDDNPEAKQYFYHSCFVENQAGKTIESIQPKK